MPYASAWRTSLSSRAGCPRPPIRRSRCSQLELGSDTIRRPRPPAAAAARSAPAVPTSISPSRIASPSSEAVGKAEDDPVEIRVVRPPVARVAGDGPAAAPAASSRRGTARSRSGCPSGLSTVDCQIVSSSSPASAWRGRTTVKRRACQSANSSPGRKTTFTVLASTARTLRIFLSVSAGTPRAPISEGDDEVGSGDGSPVAPARRGSHVVGECERVLRDGYVRDEPAGGTCSPAATRRPLRERASAMPTEPARHQERVEARGLPLEARQRPFLRASAPAYSSHLPHRRRGGRRRAPPLAREPPFLRAPERVERRRDHAPECLAGARARTGSGRAGSPARRSRAGGRRGGGRARACRCRGSVRLGRDRSSPAAGSNPCSSDRRHSRRMLLVAESVKAHKNTRCWRRRSRRSAGSARRASRPERRSGTTSTPTVRSWDCTSLNPALSQATSGRREDSQREALAGADVDAV